MPENVTDPGVLRLEWLCNLGSVLIIRYDGIVEERKHSDHMSVTRTTHVQGARRVIGYSQAPNQPSLRG